MLRVLAVPATLVLCVFSELAGNDGRGGSNVLSEQQHMVQRRASISFQVSAQLSMKSAVL